MANKFKNKKKKKEKEKKSKAHNLVTTTSTSTTDQSANNVADLNFSSHKTMDRQLNIVPYTFNPSLRLYLQTGVLPSPKAMAMFISNHYPSLNDEILTQLCQFVVFLVNNNAPMHNICNSFGQPQDAGFINKCSKQQKLISNIFDSRLLDNLPLIMSDLLKPMAYRMIAEVRKRLLLDLPAYDKEKKVANVEDDVDKKKKIVVENDAVKKVETTGDVEKEKMKDSVDEDIKEDMICSGGDKEDKGGKAPPALFVMLTTLGDQNVVAVFAGRCEPKWKAYLLGLEPNVDLKAKITSADKSYLSADTTSMNQLNNVAVNVFFTSMSRLYNNDIKNFKTFIAKTVKVIIHDELLQPAAATLLNRFADTGEKPPMLALRSLSTLVRPLVERVCKRYYNRTEKKMNNLPSHEMIISPDVRLLLDTVVPFFVAHDYYGHDCVDLSTGGYTLLLEKLKEYEKCQRLPGIPFNLMKKISLPDTKGKRLVFPEKHLVEWITFTLTHLERIKAYVLEQVEQWETMCNNVDIKNKKDRNKIHKEDGTSDKNLQSKKNSSNHKLVEGLLAKLGTTARICQFMSISEQALLLAKHQLAPLFDLYDLFHDQGLTGLTVSGFVGHSLQNLKVKYQISKKKEKAISADNEIQEEEGDKTTKWPSWASQFFDELQTVVTGDPSFAHFRQTLKKLKHEHEQQINEKGSEIDSENFSPQSSTVAPLHELLETLPLVAFHLSHLPAYFTMELAEMTDYERCNGELFLGYSYLLSFLYFNKQYQLKPWLPEDHLLQATNLLKNNAIINPSNPVRNNDASSSGLLIIAPRIGDNHEKKSQSEIEDKEALTAQMVFDSLLSDLLQTNHPP